MDNEIVVQMDDGQEVYFPDVHALAEYMLVPHPYEETTRCAIEAVDQLCKQVGGRLCSRQAVAAVLVTVAGVNELCDVMAKDIAEESAVVATGTDREGRARAETLTPEMLLGAQRKMEDVGFPGTLRDWFAGMAASNDLNLPMNGKGAANMLGVSPIDFDWLRDWPRVVAKAKYAIADAMLAEREGADGRRTLPD